MQITPAALTSINDDVTLAYNTQFWSAGSVYKRYSMVMPSTGRDSVYPRLNLVSGLREWLGDRVAQSLSVAEFTIVNRTFEETIAVKREDIEDDRLGMLKPAAELLGTNAGNFPDLLTARLLKNGHTTLTYDGQNFFDTAHPNPNADGVTQGTVANYVAGAGPNWFLFDTTKVLMPMIFQERRPFVVKPLFAAGGELVNTLNEFQWGTDGRCNAGFGLWQLGYMSGAALTPANLITAYAAMASIRRPDGTPMGIKPNMLVVSTAQFPLAKQIRDNQFDPTNSVLTPNLAAGLTPDVIENPFLN
jgi:phage major head subunit gpT-like protein